MTDWKKLSIYTSAGSRWGTRPLHEAALAIALERGLYSAIAVEAQAGFGPYLAIPTANRKAMASDLPIEVRIVDQAPAIEAFLAQEAEMLQRCIVTLEDIEIVQYPA
ncbi:MAG: DUF190 domain-containing protein [Cyanobacteria bacterium]|nr:DUF190 domain-containing protein [Cyanobacteriota bacterium]MDA0865238.1 DUF190 domain-containing protein [Cyanobacteriota bacterium]